MYNEILEGTNNLIADLHRLESNPSEENFLNANASIATLEEILKPIAEKLRSSRNWHIPGKQ